MMKWRILFMDARLSGIVPISPGQEDAMEIVVSELLKKYEDGKLSRRQLIQSLALAAVAAALRRRGGPGPAWVQDHEARSLSYQVRDYKRTRDFYSDLMGMSVVGDDGKGYCQLQFRRGAWRRRAGAFLHWSQHPHGGLRPPGRFDHLSFSIDDWDTDRVKAELERRGLKPRLQQGGAGDTPNYVSFHVEDPDGVGVQISGIARRKHEPRRDRRHDDQPLRGLRHRRDRRLNPSSGRRRCCRSAR